MKICNLKLLATLAVSLVGAQSAFADCTNSEVGESTTQISCADAVAATQVYVGGASAPDNTIATSLTLLEADGGIFVDGSIRVFDGEEGAFGDDSTVTCGVVNATAAASISTAAIAGTDLCIHKTAHGSGTGNAPLRDSTPVEFLDIDDLGTATCVASTEEPQPGADPMTGPFLEVHTGCDEAELVVQHAGASDVEPVPFFAGLAPGDLETESIIAIPWQIQVTVPMYLGLQAVQFDGTACDPAEATYDASGDADSTDGVSNAPACVPSLSEGQVRSILTGNISVVSEFVNKDGLRLNDAAPEIAAIPVPYAVGTAGVDDTAGTIPSIFPQVIAGAPLGAPVWLCRRRIGSGTQASFENVFLRQRCEDGGVTMRPQNNPFSFFIDGEGDGDNIDPTDPLQAAATTFGGSGSSDVVECMERLGNESVWGIGINSTERVYSEESLDRNNWRTVKIDGILPTSRNVTKGVYDKFSEVVCNTRPGEDTSILEVEIARDLVCGASVNASGIAEFVGDFMHEWGQGGPLGISGLGPNFLPEATYASSGGDLGLTEAEFSANPVNNFTKAALGSTNNCAVPVKVGSLAPGLPAAALPTAQVVTPSEPQGSPFTTP